MKGKFVGLLVLSSLLAACLGGDGDSLEPRPTATAPSTPEATPPPAPAPAPTPTPTPVPAPTPTPAPTPPPAPPPTFTIGGSVSGLRGTGLVLQNNGADPVTVAANGTFSFGVQLATGSPYDVSVRTQPTATPAEICDVSAGSGSVASSTITSVAVSCRAGVGKYLYTVNALNRISAFAIDPSTGALTEIAGSPFSVTLSHSARDLHVDPTGRFLYVTGSIASSDGPSSLTGFKIDSETGALTPITAGMPITTNLFFGGAFFSPNGRAIYLSELASFSGITHTDAANGIYGYTIDQATGALTPQPGSPYTFATRPARPGAFSPSGNTVYIPSGFTAGTGRLNMFKVDATTGALTATGGIDLPSLLIASEVAVHPLGRFAYLRLSTGHIGVVDVENAGSLEFATYVGFGTGSAFVRSGAFAYFLYDGSTPPLIGGVPLVPGRGAVFGFSVNTTTGALTALPGSPYPTGGDASGALALDPWSRYLAATNLTPGTGTIASYGVDTSTGRLTGTVVTPAVGATPLAVTFDPSGRFAFVPDSVAAAVSAYATSVNGTLTFVGSYPVGASPTSFARVAGLQ